MEHPGGCPPVAVRPCGRIALEASRKTTVPPLAGRLRAGLLGFLAIFAAARAAFSATYIPLPDEDLARRAPVIVRAHVVGQEVLPATEDRRDIVVTRTWFEPLEVLKGRIDSETFTIELPGGSLGDSVAWVPGTPSFEPGGEVVLFLSPPPPGSGSFSLTEFGLSKFDLVEDAAGRRFTVRPVFRLEEDDYLSGLTNGIPAGAAELTAAHPLRDAESFLSSLRGEGAGAGFTPVSYASPEGALRGSTGGARPSWVNIGGAEGGRLYRWFWDTGRTAPALVSASGTQSGLSDGSDGLDYVQNAVAQWTSVLGARVLYSLSQSGGSAQVAVNLDVESKSPYWTTAIDCSSGGIIGLGGPGNVSSAGSFRGDSGYYAISSGNVWMRKVTGGCYSWQTFRTAVLHELGHTLGLGHSDQASSAHATTQAADRASAVMVSSVPPSCPWTLQPDDIQAILWYYGSGDAPRPDRIHPVLSNRHPPN